MKALYLYSGIRKDKFRGQMGSDYPDTQFYGLNHMSKFGIDAEYKESRGLGSFRLRHFLSFFLTRGYDIVFGPSLLYALFWKKILGGGERFVILNISLTRALVANNENPLKLRIISWLLRGAAAVVCLSNVQKRHLEEQFYFLRGKAFFVPLGVDTKYHQPVYTGRKNYILSAGRDNGRDYKTVAEVAREMPEEEFHIVCSRRNLLGVKNIPANVKVFYDLPFAELAKKYREAKLMLLITHDDDFMDGSDCSGQTVLLDAFASGLPVIASRKKYLADYAEDGREAVFADFYDADDIAEKIKALDDAPTRDALARRARSAAETRFSTENMAAELARVFKSLI